MTRVIDAEAVAAIVSKVGLDHLYDMAIDRLMAVMTDSVQGLVELRERDGFVLTTPHRGLVEWMPALRHGSTVAVKMVSYHPHNPAKYLQPTILSTLYGFDAASGHLRAIVDATFATAIRTGAASAIASRLLADPSSSVLGLVGCGAQAVTQLHALDRVFDFDRVLVSDVETEAENGFAARARGAGARVEVVSLRELEDRADLICTATSVAVGEGPVLADAAAGHVNAVGSDMPGKIELPISLLRKRVVCPDHRGQASREGECQQLVDGEIGPSVLDMIARPELAAGLRDRPTVYDSTGLAVQDLAMIELFEELASECGVGVDIAIESNSGDPRDPYAFLAGSQV
ncbi:ornithine cyclodeaminase family protein [Stackebrandtia soli]|uniref:ornithine cyclodeaminase family protein n=1 Tax=Stackebrandtia soli TaxID=1892856 RepID=UPI0039EB39E2